MAEFIEIITEDLGLPLPHTQAINFDKLSFKYEEWWHTIILYQNKLEGIPIIPKAGVLYFPEQILESMYLKAGDIFVIWYSPFKDAETDIFIKNGLTCFRCGSLLPKNEVFFFDESHKLCASCYYEVKKSMAIDRKEYLEYAQKVEGKNIDKEIAAFDLAIKNFNEANALEEENNGTIQIKNKRKN